MKCVRCNQKFNDSTPCLNAECYGGTAYFACPHCGKLYQFSRIVVSSPVADEECCCEEDEWGNRIVKDSEYNECK